MFELFKKNFSNVNAEQVQGWIKDEDVVIVDVREEYEYKKGHIPQAKLIPLNTIPQRLSEIDKSKKIIVVCASGGRSKGAASFLSSEGYQVYNMMGGMMAWAGPIK
ncbi:MAG: rhodanese-like domain-containing protein [Firmicutes bacterium HGW-Firmicutes-1]|jgi:rhodanese-related sulfurtransferase|nr:MAG: rhodanese-like domain-containing protein [Firmicutes bacterium HGW-Firmicutes-1]